MIAAGLGVQWGILSTPVTKMAAMVRMMDGASTSSMVFTSSSSMLLWPWMTM